MIPANDSWSTTFSSAIFSWVRLLIVYSFLPMALTVTAAAGKTATASSASTHSRANITPRSTAMVPTWRTAMTRTDEVSRPSRFTSPTTRVISSAECSEVK